MSGLFRRELRLALRSGNRLITGILFFLTVIIITPFAIGPAPELLAQVSAGIFWIAALLSTLLGLDRLFQTDHEDGSLEIMMTGTDFLTLTVMVFIKCLAHWVTAVLPLIAATPLLAIFLHMEPAAICATTLSLLLGTPAITLIGAAGTALTLALPRGGVLAAVIILPLSIPVIIFGIAAVHTLAGGLSAPLAPLLFLCALTLFFAVLGPVTAAAALKYMAE